MRKNHATNCKGCHGHDQPFTRSLWFIATVEEALEEVAVPSAPWTGVFILKDGEKARKSHLS